MTKSEQVNKGQEALLLKCSWRGMKPCGEGTKTITQQRHHKLCPNYIIIMLSMFTTIDQSIGQNVIL